MTFPDDGFFHALQQDSDDTLRLVFADFLEERGDDASIARAELIRVQVELQRWSPLYPRFATLTDRQNELIETWERVWLGKWTKVLTGWSFRRGLVEAVCADASDFLEYADEWFAEWPTLSVVKLTRASGHLPELAASPWLAHLHGLDLSDNDINDESLVYLTTSRYIPLLQALDLSDNPIGLRGASLLIDAVYADELRELHLSGCGLGGAGLRRLLDGRGRQWRRLDLSRTGIEAKDMLPFADSPVLRNLTALDLSWNELGADGIETLVNSPNVAGLVDLGLSHTKAGNAAVTSLAKSKCLSNLRSLDLRWHSCTPRYDHEQIDWGGIGELGRSPMLGQLRRLLLTGDSKNTDWIADVMSVARPVRELTVSKDWWMTQELRKSKYLMPSQFIECDLEDIWWLGDRFNRDRPPCPWGF